MKYLETPKKLDPFSLLLFLNDKNDEDDDNSDFKELQLSLRSTSLSQFLYYKIKEFLKSSFLVKNTKKSFCYFKRFFTKNFKSIVLIKFSTDVNIDNINYL